MNKKGLLVVLFFGGIMVTSGFGLQNMMSPPLEDVPELTGTPADNFPEEQRAQFCGSSDAKSTDYVQEFSIPTLCTNPLAIITDYDGNVWFAETNTGNLAKFDPNTETFSEYENPLWPPGARSMMWGMDYAPDGSIWYTDEAYDSIWKFSTIDEKYERLTYPSEGDSLPQKLLVDGSQIIINDFTGNKLTFLDPNQSGKEINYLSIPSPVDDSVTADFAVDANDNVWYTNWLFQQGGVLVKFDQNGYLKSVANSDEKFLPLLDFIEIYQLPETLLTPNGIVVADDGTIWLADTTSSSFFNFDPVVGNFVQYVTSDPQLSTYGNQTGVVKTPISRPYWIESDDQGRLVFNEQTGNNISVMDPISQLNWSKILVVYESTTGKESAKVIFEATDAIPSSHFVVSSLSQKDLLGVSLILSSTHDFLNLELVETLETFQLDSDAQRSIFIIVNTSEDAIPGTYKVLLGAQLPDVAISKYVTVTIE